MTTTYSEITDPKYIQDCVEIQKKLFKIADADTFPAAFFSMLIRKEHPLGLVVGCFREDENGQALIGLTIAVADKRNDSAYIPFLGLLPEYRNGRYGYNLLLQLREVALKHGYKTMYGIFEPLDSNLGKLYTTVGMRIRQYILEPFKTESGTKASPDKVLFHWDIDSDYVTKKINREISNSFQEIIENVPIAKQAESTKPKYLLEIPATIDTLKQGPFEMENEWRTKTRTFLSSYLNNKGYQITDCIKGRLQKERKAFYILEKI